MSKKNSIQKRTPGSLHPAGSAAWLKAEIGVLKEKRSERWWHDSPNNRDLEEVLILLDKLAAVTVKLEHRMPPNSEIRRVAD